jgi:hypothetical protein
MDEKGYIVVEPKILFPGCLSILVPTDKLDRFREIETHIADSRYIARAIISDNIPLSGDLEEILKRRSEALLWINGNPLTINLEFPHYLPFFYDLIADTEGRLAHIDVEVEAKHPTLTLTPARTAINQLLDTLMRVVWLPLVITRIDVYAKGESEPLIHQLLLPFTEGLRIGPLGGFGSFTRFAPYEALLREAISATSPYYRFLCAYRLFEGVKYLRSEIAKLVNRFSVQVQMPRPPQIENDFLRSLGFQDEFVKGIKTPDDLIAKSTEPRNAIAHFLLSKGDTQPLHISSGENYRFYALAGAVLLHYAHKAVSELMIYYNQHVDDFVSRGTILILPEDRDRCVIKADHLWRTIKEAQDDESDEEDYMSRPMFISVVEGRKIEFINIQYVVRVEIFHPSEGEPGGGKLYLQDGTERKLGENEINWIMRMMQNLRGEPAIGTQDASPGYWQGEQAKAAESAIQESESS